MLDIGIGVGNLGKKESGSSQAGTQNRTRTGGGGG